MHTAYALVQWLSGRVHRAYTHMHMRILLLQVDWPSGPAGLYVAEVLSALRVFLQDPRLSLLTCAGEAEADAWRWLQLLPLAQAAQLL